MENYEALALDANKFFNTADHLAFVTYPFVRDSKMLWAIIENIYSSLTKAMDALLYYDKFYKRLTNIPLDFSLRYELFKNKTALRYEISKVSISLIKEINELIEQQKSSSMTFSKQERLIICSETLRVKVITEEQVKKYVYDAKPFIVRMNSIILPKND